MEVSWTYRTIFDKESNPVFQTEVRIEGIPAGTEPVILKRVPTNAANVNGAKKLKNKDAWIHGKYRRSQNTSNNSCTEAEKTKEEIAEIPEQEPEVITVTESITQKELTEEHELSETIWKL